MADPLPKRSIEAFDAQRHQRESFRCGVESLDLYFRSRARQERDKYAAAAFVTADGPTVIGYYTLSSYSIHAGELPEHLVRKLPRYPRLPATLIGRLAVDERYRRKGYGEELLLDALKRCLAITPEVGSLAVIVDAENDNAIEFYRSYGFLPFPDQPNRLFLAMQTIRDLFLKSGTS